MTHERVVGVYKRNIIPVLLTTIKRMVLAMGGLYYTFNGNVDGRLGLGMGITILIGYLVFNFFYGLVNSYIVLYAHKFGLYMKKNPEIEIKDGIKEVSDIKVLLKEGTIYFLIITVISLVTGSVVGTVGGVGFIGVLIAFIELIGVIGLLIFGVIVFLVLGVSIIIINGITDSILVYILIYKKKDVKGSVTFIKNNFIRFGLIDTAFSFIQLIVLIFTNVIGLVIIMPWVLEWKYDQWVRDVPEF